MGFTTNTSHDLALTLDLELHKCAGMASSEIKNTMAGILLLTTLCSSIAPDRGIFHFQSVVMEEVIIRIGFPVLIGDFLKDKKCQLGLVS